MVFNLGFRVTTSPSRSEGTMFEEVTVRATGDGGEEEVVINPVSPSPPPSPSKGGKRKRGKDAPGPASKKGKGREKERRKRKSVKKYDESIVM